jgi:DNA polymerase III delta prime subunit
LEDGPPKTVFVFVLEDENDLLSTIQSRSVSVKFSNLEPATIRGFLSRYEADNEKVQLCTNLSGGSISSALEYLRDGGLADREAALAFVRDLPRKPPHQVIDGVDKALKPETLFYLLRHVLTDMLILGSTGLEAHVVNFDKIEDLRRYRAAFGESAVAFGVEELNRLNAKKTLIKGTFPTHLKASLLKVRGAIRA